MFMIVFQRTVLKSDAEFLDIGWPQQRVDLD